jgi:predicted ATP-grasp superfamily ATP-dependent carboligase
MNALGITRNLGRKGIDVHCVVGRGRQPAAYSKYCTARYVVPGVNRDRARLRSCLVTLGRRLKRPAVVFPTDDRSVLHLSHLLQELDGYAATIPRSEVVEVLVNKRRFYQSLREQGVPHPSTVYPDDDPDALERLTFPVFVKPSISPVFFAKFHRKGFVAQSTRELRDYLSLVSGHGIDVVVQEIVQGPFRNHYTVEGVFSRDARPLILFARRLLRRPFPFSNSAASVSIPLAEVSHMGPRVVQYLSALGYQGVFNATLKKDARDDVMKLIEVNARSWWYNAFPTACGVNVILAAYHEALGQEVGTAATYATGRYCIVFCRDVRSIVTMAASRELSLRELLASARGKRHYTIYDRADLKPFLVSLLKMGLSG